jgi:hypothetical protein
MTFSKLRPILAAVMVIALAAFATMMFVLDQRTALRRSRLEPPIDYAARFAPLRARLDRNSVVGYVTSPVPDGRGGITFDTRGYYKARYVLSPARVVWETPCERAIGDFYDARFVATMLNRTGYLIEQNFGDGVMLLKRRAAP